MLDIKIGKTIFKIKAGDVFGDNGACIQLLSQTIYTGRGMQRSPISPTLPKKLSKEIHTLFEFKVTKWGQSDVNKLYIVTGLKVEKGK